MLTKVLTSAVLSACILGAGSVVLLSSINSSVLAQSANNRLVPLRDGLFLNYDRATILSEKSTLTTK